MRIKFLIFIIILTYSATFGQSFEIIDGDTVNNTDANGLKQGHWIIFNKTKKLPNYADDQKVEEGEYKNGKKVGVWKGYHNNGVLKYEITYVDDIPNGYAKFYYKTGNICEEGLWKMNKWVGQYKYYYENGQTAYDFVYNSKGEREGVQKYFHENGNLMVIGTWTNGKESGKLTEYYEDGSVKSEKIFIDGKCDNTKTVIYTPKDTSKIAIKEDKIKDKDKDKDKDKRQRYYG